jgi:glutamate-5-semialdehyde dehydrogenase
MLRDLVTLDQYLDLVIPYGRASLVQQVLRQATIPVLKTTIGNCYVYWSPTGNTDILLHLIADSHKGEPDAVNAVEKVLIHRSCTPGALAALFGDLKSDDFHLRGDDILLSKYPGLEPVTETDWAKPYLDRTVAFKMVDSMDDAINWINRYSSGHADCIVTDSYSESQKFIVRANSATVYVNASPRFYRCSPSGHYVLLGMSNQRGHHWGTIGLHSLTTTKSIVHGMGKTVF